MEENENVYLVDEAIADELIAVEKYFANKYVFDSSLPRLITAYAMIRSAEIRNSVDTEEEM